MPRDLCCNLSFLCTIYTSYHEQIVRMGRTLIFVAGNNESVSKQKSMTGINFISLSILARSSGIEVVLLESNVQRL